LILNAGIFGADPRVTADNFEATFQVNHLAHFLLTNLLTPLLLSTPSSRIVIVSSDAHKTANIFRIRPENITWEYLSPTDPKKIPSAFLSYGLSKLCNIWHAKALHERLAGKGVTVNTLHPGVIATNIQRNSKFLQRFLSLAKPLTKTVEQGAATTVYCAVAAELNPGNGGLYYDDCHPRTPTSSAQSHENAERFWSISEQMVKQHQEKHSQAA